MTGHNGASAMLARSEPSQEGGSVISKEASNF